MFYLHDFLLDIIFETHSKTEKIIARIVSIILSFMVNVDGKKSQYTVKL